MAKSPNVKHGPIFWFSLLIVALFLTYVFITLGSQWLTYGFNAAMAPTLASCSGYNNFNTFGCLIPTYNIKSGTLMNMPFEYFAAGNAILYNVQLACTSNKTTGNLPFPQNKFINMSSVGGDMARTASLNYNSIIVPYVSYNVANIQCYSPSGSHLMPNVNDSIITTAYIWVNYTQENASVNSISNPWITKEIVKVTLYLR